MGTILAMAVGTVFAFSEVDCSSFPLCVITSFMHAVGCELRFIRMASPGTRKVSFTATSGKSFQTIGDARRQFPDCSLGDVLATVTSTGVLIVQRPLTAGYVLVASGRACS